MNSTQHLTTHPGYIQVQENNPMLFHWFGLRVQLCAWNSVLMTKDPQDTSKPYGLVSIEPCILLAR